MSSASRPISLSPHAHQLCDGSQASMWAATKFEFNPKDGIDNPALSLAEDTGKYPHLWGPRFYLLNKDSSETFGFCLHKELGCQGHIIRQVELGGLAQRRGLQDGDRLLQVNGHFVDHMDHKKVTCIRMQDRGCPHMELPPGVACPSRALLGGNRSSPGPLQVVQKIKASGNQVLLAVLDSNTYETAKALGRDLSQMLPADIRPRLCHITRDKSGFGFSISGPEGKSGVGVAGP
uniref:PDZ domain-containing protein n=1 Tax=Nothoprocta perdicaria TaxID=30464 RepID=A0A8C6YSR4_NOTPE